MICGSMLRVNPALRAVAQGWLHRCRRGARAGGGEPWRAPDRGGALAILRHYGWALKNRAALRRSGRRSPKYRTVSSRNRPLKARIETRARPSSRRRAISFRLNPGCQGCSLAFEPALRRQGRRASRTALRPSRARSWLPPQARTSWASPPQSRDPRRTGAGRRAPTPGPGPDRRRRVGARPHGGVWLAPERHAPRGPSGSAIRVRFALITASLAVLLAVIAFELVGYLGSPWSAC